jgi:hypothetical protein
MATAAQITANQQNARLSTGPRTDTGKLTVSRNAVTHGLAATKFFLSAEEKPLFEEVRDALLDHYRPASAHERALVEEVAETRWRCRTARAVETSFFDVLVSDQRKADASLTVERALARVFIDDTQQKRMRLMMRYLAAATRAAEKALAELERVIAVRREEEERQAEVRAMMALRAPAMSPVGPKPAGDASNRVCSVTPHRADAEAFPNPQRSNTTEDHPTHSSDLTQ